VTSVRYVLVLCSNTRQLAVCNHLTVLLLVCCTGDLVGLVAETLEGLPIITAFGQNKYFVATAANKIDEHHRALFNGESLNLWLAFYCDLYGAILVLSVCIFAVTQRTVLGAAAVGLAFSNTIQVSTPTSYSSIPEAAALSATANAAVRQQQLVALSLPVSSGVLLIFFTT
jgi:ABC-type multidrug transport system fused ATPase/permease subunit